MKKPRRSESIFGLHFDFHASPDNEPIGSTTTEEMVQKIIDTLKPDFIQCDSKGHPGIASYPSKIGNAAPVIDKDVLKIWRKVTEENGVALYTHYSGIFDAKAVKDNPEWAAVASDGTRHKEANNLYCDYAKKILIPQLLELAGDYKTDGVWVDGDCWGVLRDRGEEIKAEFKAETDCDILPEKQGDKYFGEYLDILRANFKKYLNNYINKVHEKYPDFQIASNWAFTTYMPEPVSADVSYLSGDVFGYDMINRLKYESKFAASQNITWDMMSWCMAVKPADTENANGGGQGSYMSIKSPVQLRQEASIVLAHGGAFQVYIFQNLDASVSEESLNVVKGLSEFCKSRKDYCFGGKSKAEIALLYSTKTAYDKANEAFGFMDGTLSNVWGNVKLISDLGLPVDFLCTENLNKKLNDYSLIVIPEWEMVDNKEELLEFTQNGGRLLIIGSKACIDFKAELGIETLEEFENKRIFLKENGFISSLGYPTNALKVKLNKGKPLFDYHYKFRDGEKEIAASVTDFGKGKIAGVYFDTGLIYNSVKDIMLRDFIKKAVDELLPEKLVEVKGSRFVEVTALGVNGKLCINLVNTSGPHTDSRVMVYDSVPEVKNITVEIKCEKPKEIFCEPEHKKMEFKYENGRAIVDIESLEMYDILDIIF